jgi:hypothetical protein
MGNCAKSKAPEQDPINPKRIGVDSSLPCPNYWFEQDLDTHFRKLVKCEVEDKDELVALQELMDKTAVSEPGKHHPKLQIEWVVRVEDWHMWDEYRRSISYIADIRGDAACASNNADVLATTISGTAEKVPLTTRCLPKSWAGRLEGEANEAYLWHATPRAIAEKIQEHDFDTHKSGTANGQVLGRGIYLAESPSLSDEYAVKGPQGRYCMLLVRAVLGKVHATRRFSKWRGKKLVMTTFTTKLVKKGECDSVIGDRALGNRKGIREYCVANNTQLYPEYLILYNRLEAVDTAKVAPET